MKSLARVMAVGVLSAAITGTAHAAPVPGGGASSAAQRDHRRPAIGGGHDAKSAWMAAEYRQLQIRKRTDKQSRVTSIEIRYGTDAVALSVGPGGVSVARGGHIIEIDTPEALISLQGLLGGSHAVFATRAMLSDLETESDLEAPDMSLLSVAAFVAALVGDTGAPQRLADRFVAKHRGIVRLVRQNGSCWAEYTTEATAAWDHLQGCMNDAEQRDFFRAAYERLACNVIWLLRAESSWFEYLACLSPLSPITQ